MANPIAVPGTVVSSGAAVSPGGAQGPTTVSTNANNKATLGTDSLLLVQGTAAGIAATTHAQTVSGDDPQLTNARTPTAHEASHVTGSDQIPLASASTKGLLNQTSGNTTDFIDGTNNSQALQPVIWSVRLRTFNAVGNPTFETDQIKCDGNYYTATGKMIDRWYLTKSGAPTGVIQYRRIKGQTTAFVPGTSFNISSSYLEVSPQSLQASMAAGDAYIVQEVIEGAVMRELIGDAHSISILTWSDIASPITLGVSLRDNGSTRSYVAPITINPNWTLSTIPNIPVWASGGAWSTDPGAFGYTLSICLAAGSTWITTTNSTWVTGNFVGCIGQGNYLNTGVGKRLQLYFIQHEPGALCSTLIDCSFGQNYDGDFGCLRYYCKSYDYPTVVSSGGYVHARRFWSDTTALLYGPWTFPKIMAKPPTCRVWNPSTGAANSVYDNTTGAAVSISSMGLISTSVLLQMNGTFTVNHPYLANLDADTGW